LQDICKTFGLTGLLLLGFGNGHAQSPKEEKDKAEYEQKAAEQLAKYELRDLKTSLLLNKSFFTEDEVEYYRHLPRNAKKQIEVPTDADQWQGLYERLVTADLREKGQRLPDYEKFAEKDRKKLTKSNTIPIGILNLDATLLTEEQLKENEALKKQSKKPASATVDGYERIHFINASVLQEDVFQSEVNFQLSPSLHISNNNVRIKQVELDFHDGKGYRSHPLSEKLIPYRFSSLGERLLSIRLLTERGAFVFQTLINVKQLERIPPFREFEITVPRVREDTITPIENRRNGRMGVTVPGGNVRIVLGCDQVFDKPIIIGEGFDMVNSTNLDDLEAKYRIQLQNFMNNGYDLVLLDYHNATTYIENNAQVMKALIHQVYQTKVGNTDMIVIGESMSGLVARYALRQMEFLGENHHVSHFISYDSPHQGANIPVGLTQLYWEAKPGLLSILGLVFSKTVRDYFNSLQTPAATQMVKPWGGRFTYGAGVSHPEFQEFRTNLQNLGNGGYPQNCRNVTMINGSRNATDRRIFDNHTYGSRILYSFIPSPILQSIYLDIHTQVLNQTDNVLRFSARGRLLNSPFPYVDINYQSSVNDDFTPGGRIVRIPARLRKPEPAFEFSFIPTYSSTDYSGPRDTQAQRELLNVNSIAASQTPFAAIYGGIFNSDHTFANNVLWNNLGTSENLYNAATACNNPNTLPTPTISIESGASCISMQRSQNGQQDPVAFTATTNASNGQYRHIWSISAPGQSAIVTTSGSYTFYLNAPGSYTVSVTREDLNSPGIRRAATTVFTAINCDNLYNTNTGPCDWLEGDFVTQLASGQNLFAHFSNATLYARTDNGSFVSRSTLQANGVFGEFADCFAQTDPRSGGGLLLPNGCYTIKAKHSDRFMQPENGNNGARIRQYPANGQNNQVFELEGVDADAYKIKSYGTSKVWEAAGAGTAYQTGVQLWDYSGGNHQKWLISGWGDGTYRLAPKHEQTIIADVEGTSTSDGAGLHLWGQHAGDNQRFYVSSVGCPTTGGCPQPTLTANPTSVSPNSHSILTASGCPGTVHWANGLGDGPTKDVYPTSTTTYSATCEANGCTSSAGSVTVNVGSNPPPSLCAEAESSGGNGPITGDPNASGGSTRGAENDYNHYVDYQVSVPSAGSYTLTLQYYSTSAPNVSVQVGSTTPQPITLPNSGSWNIVYTTHSVNVQLAAGSNTIRIQGTGGGSCRQDKICVSGGSPCGNPPNPPTVSASPSTPPSNLSASGCNGTVNWSHGASGANVTVNPTSTTTYTATCTVDGCTSGASNSVTVTVNGGGSLNQCIESENASGDGPITGDPNASGGSTRGAENNYNHYVEYEVTGVPNAGNYTLTLQYYSSSAPTVEVSVTQGGSGSQTTAIPNSGSWNIVHTTHAFTVTLAAGTNKIKVRGTGGGSCRQDRICVTGNGTARLSVAEEPTTDSPELTVSPNPNNGEFEASFYVESGRRATLSVSDMQGREVWQKNLVGAGAHREQVRLPAQSVGAYILLLNKDATHFKAKVEFKRVIVVK
jgi:hypothetical protein